VHTVLQGVPQSVAVSADGHQAIASVAGVGLLVFAVLPDRYVLFIAVHAAFSRPPCRTVFRYGSWSPALSPLCVRCLPADRRMLRAAMRWQHYSGAGCASSCASPQRTTPRRLPCGPPSALIHSLLLVCSCSVQYAVTHETELHGLIGDAPAPVQPCMAARSDGACVAVAHSGGRRLAVWARGPRRLVERSLAPHVRNARSPSLPSGR
jgi:hypothetical protein